MSLSSLPTLQTLLHSLQPAPTKLGSDAFVVVNMSTAEAVAPPNAAVPTPKELPFVSDDSESEIVRDRRSMINGLDTRRKRRRKRKKNCSVDQRLLVGYGKNGVLSSEQEAELSFCLKEGARIEVAKLRITESEEHPPAILRRGDQDKVLCNARESREILAREFRGLAASIAAAYQGKGLSLQDLIQEGIIGLLHGAEKFDPHRGYKLSTYVYWWIKQAIIKAVANKSRLVRLPVGKCELVAKVAEANNMLSTTLRRKPSYHETAEMLNVNVSTVRLVSERSRSPISLDKAVTDHRGHMTLQEILPGAVEMTPEKMVERQLVKEEVVKLLNSTLNKREAEIVGLYFGLNGETPRSCEEIGRLLKLSRERVRQIKAIALSKLQHSSVVDSLKFYVV